MSGCLGNNLQVWRRRVLVVLIAALNDGLLLPQLRVHLQEVVAAASGQLQQEDEGQQSQTMRQELENEEKTIFWMAFKGWNPIPTIIFKRLYM